jgi:hypothetical protein
MKKKEKYFVGFRNYFYQASDYIKNIVVGGIISCEGRKERKKEEFNFFFL